MYVWKQKEIVIGYYRLNIQKRNLSHNKRQKNIQTVLILELLRKIIKYDGKFTCIRQQAFNKLNKCRCHWIATLNIKYK